MEMKICLRQVTTIQTKFQTMISRELLVGIWFLIYGVLKIVVSILALTLPSATQLRLKHTPLGLFITGDKTSAGTAFDIALLFYACYSILHGLNLMGFVIPIATAMFRSLVFKATVYIVVGAFLIIYYGLVLYSNVAISKEPTEYHTYETYILIGIVFLLTAGLIPYYGKWM